MFKIIFFLYLKLINSKLHSSPKCNNENILWIKIYDDYLLSDKYNYIGDLKCEKKYIDLPNSSIIYIETWHLYCNNSLNNSIINNSIVNNSIINNWIIINCKKQHFINTIKINIFKNNILEKTIYKCLIIIIIIYIIYKCKYGTTNNYSRL